MRRLMPAVLGAMALALALPGIALADKGHHHHKKERHRARVHARHARFRLERFGARLSSQSTGTSGAATGTSTATGTTEAGTGAPASSAPEDAGTVVSYSNGKLKLELSSKSTVEGTVTADTRIRCIREEPSTTSQTGESPSDESQGDGSGQGDDQSRGDMSRGGDERSSGSDESQQGNDGEDGTDTESQATPEPVCDTSDLTAGTVVRWAELRVGPSGSEFESLVLVLK